AQPRGPAARARLLRAAEPRARSTGRREPVRRAALLALLAMLVGACAASAQGRSGDRTGRLMREAAALEANGDVAGAERVLREVVARQPAPPGAVLALERVLSRQGRGTEILPVIEGF